MLTLVLLNPDIPCLCKQFRSRSVGQLIWIYTVCHSVCEFVSTTWIKQSDWLKYKNGRGILIYSEGQGLKLAHMIQYFQSNWNWYKICVKVLLYRIYPKFSDTSTPYHTCSKILTSTIYYQMYLKIAGWVANNVDSDEIPHSAVSHLGLHYLLRPVCLNSHTVLHDKFYLPFGL